MREAVILFTRVPLPGQTKTRLSPCYSGAECAALHTAFLRDEAAACDACGRDVFVYFTPEGEAPRLREILGDSRRLRPQRGGGLGEKMNNAMAEVLAAGYDACALMGADIPELRRADIDAAFAALADADAALIPTADGGYCLAAMKRPIPAMFENQTYGTGTVLEQTVRAIADAGLRAAVLPPLHDVDTPEDLRALRARICADDASARTHTRRYLEEHRKISAVIPVYNEEKALPGFLRELEKLRDCEILFADGGSTDGTLALLKNQRVVRGVKGRAAQMNAGAAAAGGDVLLFLHADSALPDQAAEEVLEVLKHARWGCFGIAFAPTDWLMDICARRSNQRAREQGVVFGDQGIFMERTLFERIGGFPNLPLMEDYQLSLNLTGEPLGMTTHSLVTSSRRFQGGALHKLRVMAQMQRLRRRYRAGENIETIAAEYRDLR